MRIVVRQVSFLARRNQKVPRKMLTVVVPVLVLTANNPVLIKVYILLFNVLRMPMHPYFAYLTINNKLNERN